MAFEALPSRRPAVRSGLVALLVLAAGSASAQKVPDVRVDLGNAPGSVDSYFPEVAAVGSAVYVVWTEAPSGATHAFFTRSLDGGETWLAAAQDLDQATSGGQPSVAAVEGAVYVAFDAVVNGETGVWVQRSLDGGTTWTQRRRLGGGGTSYGGWVQLAAQGSAVHAVYMDHRDGQTDIYYDRSLDFGATWLPADVRLDSGDPAGASDSVLPDLAASGDTVAVAWWDRRHSSSLHRDVYFNGSLDGGTTWLPADVRLNTRNVPGTASLSLPQVAALGSSAFVTWAEGGRIFVNRSLDGGAHWLPHERRVDRSPTGIADGRTPEIAVMPGERVGRAAAPLADVYVVWIDRRDNPSPLGNVYFTRSTDSGTTWATEDVRLNTGTPATEGSISQERMAVDGSSIFVAWWDRTSGNEVRLNRSLDRGNTWLASEERMDSSGTSGHANTCALAAAGGSVHVVWEDGRNDFHLGRRDIYYTLALGHQPYGAGLAGSAGLVPRLAGLGQPSIGRTITLDVTQGLGGASGVLAIGLAGRAAAPFLGGTRLVELPVMQFPIQLSGAGTASLSFPIPSSIAMIGTRVDAQAFVTDPAAVQGMSMSAGLETWML
jgi:hypothetical protein